MTINDLFNKFLNKINPTDLELKKARKRANHVKERVLRLDIGVFDVRNSGSHAKGTAIHPLNDIDMVFHVDMDKFPYNKERILHRIARELRPSYPNNDVITATHSIKLKYSDGFHVDIVPALCHDGQIDGAEIIDRETGNWIKTSIPKHINFANEMNEIDPRYKRFVRMFKIWKAQRRRKYPSFLLELLVAYAVKQGLPRGWEHAVCRIFEIIQNTKLNTPIYFNEYYREINYNNKIKNPVIVLDPANPNNNVANFMTPKIKDEFMNAWSASFRWARSALASTTKKDKVYYWRKIFGNTFPSR